jgi:hypothetical protein
MVAAVPDSTLEFLQRALPFLVESDTHRTADLNSPGISTTTTGYYAGPSVLPLLGRGHARLDRAPIAASKFLDAVALDSLSTVL